MCPELIPSFASLVGRMSYLCGEMKWGFRGDVLLTRQKPAPADSISIGTVCAVFGVCNPADSISIGTVCAVFGVCNQYRTVVGTW